MEQIYKTREDLISYLINYLGSRKSLRIEQWNTDEKSWRVGLEWYAEDDYEFIVEKPTLLDCLIACYNYLDPNVSFI